MTDPIRRFIPTLAHGLFMLCKFITRHRVTIDAMIAEYGGDKKAALQAALDDLHAACVLFVGLMETIDPNWHP